MADYKTSIFLNKTEYRFLYEHIGSGSYYISNDAPYFESWLDVDNNGNVSALFNGQLFRIGKLNGTHIERGTNESTKNNI